ncbi:MAG TPA: di-heme oxidoredictase family protein, partial [Candidatus Eisenbacteria bacterium]|nr:di-heme oxidoredictase family protein [Candidatus Eisenbacteria bacterium]
LPAGVDVSLRMPPAVFGVGLIEALTDSTILSHADPGDADADGISGRANMVTPPSYVPATEPGAGPGLRVGRFGRKAAVSSLFQQTVTAYSQDMGVTSPALPDENVNPLAPPGLPDPDRAPDPEVNGGQVNDVEQYMRMLAPPTPGEWTDQRRRGQTLFTSARCSACHIPTMRTGAHEIEALANRDVTLYSDLLLHDLGPGLADNRPDGDADGQEWRTAPLWGLRIAREFLNGQLFLLHDGRAHSVDEAIRLHGGEATAARDAFLAMPPADRAAVLDFVESR